MKEKAPETTKENTTKTETHASVKDSSRGRRNLIFSGMALCGILECVFSGIIRNREPYQMAVLIFLGILYSVTFLAGMELYRIQKDWFYEKARDYRYIAGWYAVSCTAAVLFEYLPEYTRPVLLLAAGGAIVSNSFFGMLSGIFHVAVFAVCGQENAYMLLCDIFLLAGGCIAVTFFKEIRNRRWGIIFLFLYVFDCILIFSFIRTGQLNWNVLLFGACNGAVSAAGAWLLYQTLYRYLQNSRKQELERILKSEFGLVQAVSHFSQADYNHGRKVSEIARNCAALVGADPDVAAAGGFYYRIGRMEGEPYVENGVALARSNHLPREIVGILREYNGEQQLPSTLESAIVHIVDSVVAKFDVLDRATLSSSWNQDMLVYQTLNENSASGLYDQSGFSMNMFLKIRDYLIKEAELF